MYSGGPPNVQNHSQNHNQSSNGTFTLIPPQPSSELDTPAYADLEYVKGTNLKGQGVVGNDKPSLEDPAASASGGLAGSSCNGGPSLTGHGGNGGTGTGGGGTAGTGGGAAARPGGLPDVPRGRDVAYMTVDDSQMPVLEGTSWQSWTRYWQQMSARDGDVYSNMMTIQEWQAYWTLRGQIEGRDYSQELQRPRIQHQTVSTAAAWCWAIWCTPAFGEGWREGELRSGQVIVAKAKGLGEGIKGLITGTWDVGKALVKVGSIGSTMGSPWGGGDLRAAQAELAHALQNHPLIQLAEATDEGARILMDPERRAAVFNYIWKDMQRDPSGWLTEGAIDLLHVASLLKAMPAGQAGAATQLSVPGLRAGLVPTVGGGLQRVFVPGVLGSITVPASALRGGLLVGGSAMMMGANQGESGTSGGEDFERGQGGARKHTPGHRPEYIRQQAKEQDAAKRKKHKQTIEEKLQAIRDKWRDLSDEQRKLLKGVPGVDPEATRPVDLK